MNSSKGILTILKSGPGITIQDRGRKLWTRFGVPTSGPLDKISFEWVNHILRNEPNSAVLEIGQPGLKLEFSAPCEISLAGANAHVHLNQEPVDTLKKIPIPAHGILEIGHLDQGSRLYMGIRGGFQTPVVMDSRSFYKQITTTDFLYRGDQVPYISTTPSSEPGFSNPKWNPAWFQIEKLEFYPGPDFHRLTSENLEHILEKEFTVSPVSSRMGIHLLESVPNEIPELPTNPVYPGTVQLTSGGKLIVLGPDAQVTGGYPRIMQLTEFSQSVLAQKKTGQKVQFIKKEL
ncbi:biotin-dependent carboxylase-like uncharacterized protein [Algoriphagus boseongensis]|uniref:Biotin-dependent carboxylase-like uncharacterized protein n=1 Tax=Algoriphagus boseongensis TaxID=1442587 RepID=A0A4R6T6X1_9BACT|nr:biotin-dependent carboxyltransferase family protein [Algoriphagus boseongensis]TDQ18908.1 biotin-dependent carboxylase-like uncharacterized protein [Algoriphagus boseongensis]